VRQVNIGEAARAARRFLSAVRDFDARMKKKDVYDFQGCKESGALRRASMDLSRALSAMRKP